MKILNSYEVITNDGKSHFVSAYSKKEVADFWQSSKPKKVIERGDIDPETNTNITKENRGGSRPGAGRPKGEPTKTLSYRVPVKFADIVDKAIRKIISRISKNFVF